MEPTAVHQFSRLYSPLFWGGKYTRDGLRFPPPTVKSAFGRHDLSTAITKSVLIAYFAKIAVLIGK